MSAQVAALRAVMGADTAEFERAMKGVEGSLKRVATVASFVGNALADALTGAFSSLKDSIKQAVENADKMEELAEAIGISVEKLSGLRFAADLSGVSLDSLSTNLVKLGKAMAESVSEPSGTAARTLQAMGLSAVDAAGQLRPINDVLLAIANKFQTYEDGAAKITLATNLFGRAGAAMIPLLNQGEAGIDRLAAEASRLGLTLDSKTVKSAAAFNDALTKMGRVWDGIIMQLTAKLVPVLETVANWMVNLNQKSQTLQYALAAIDVVIKSLVTTGIIAKAMFEALVAQIGTLVTVLKMLASADLMGAWEALKQGPVDTTAAVQKAIDSFKELWGLTSQWQTFTQPMADGMPQVAAPIVASANAMRDAFKEWKDEARAAMDEIVNSPIETYTAKMAELQVALQTGVINWRTYGQMVRKVEEENRNNITSTASLLASTLTTVFGKSKAAGIAAAIINTAVGITNALAKLPPPYSWAQAALIAASGAAQIATIRSTNEKGGGGGAPSVHGGAGEGGGSEAQQAGPSQMFQVNLHGSRFSRDDVVGLIEDMNEAIADGAHLVVRQQ
jgi:TP901 family phage tail tape measure protein